MHTNRIELYINDVLQTTHPIYADDLSIEKEREDGEMYRRTSVSSTLTFVGSDFDLIYNSLYETSFSVKIYDAETSTLLATGTFEKTDCTFNVDDKICDVKITSADEYTKLLNGIDNEYNIIKLAPERESVTLKKRAIFQVYFLGDTKLTNIIGNMSYEVDAREEITDETELSDMGFIALKKFASFEVDVSQYTYMPSGVSGIYRAVYNGASSKFENENGYYFYYRDESSPSGASPIYDSEDVEVKPHSYSQIRVIATSYSSSFLSSVSIQESYSGGYVELDNCAPVRVFGYARVLTDSNSWASPLGTIVAIDTSTDVGKTNLNYHYAMKPTSIETTLKEAVMVSYAVQSDPTEWGVNGDGDYFVKPTPQNTENNVIPIGWNKWIPMSIWFESTTSLATTIDGFSVDWVLRDAFPLWSVIKVLLAQIDSTITFNGTSTYSEFLYGTISPSVITEWVKNLLYITPVTNVKKTYYDQAARKGTITLRQVLDMLKNTAQLYWFIDSNKRLRIEHITWFKNGGNYYQQTALVDTTTIKSPMSMKSWDFAKNTLEYNIKDLSKRYEFSWQDECSDLFDGFAIDIKNRYASSAKTNKVSVDNFISDIDLIISAPDNIDDDCFALIGTNANKVCVIAGGSQGMGNFGHDFVCPTYYVQNGYLSFFFLVSAYWIYDMSGGIAETEGYTNINGNVGLLKVKGTKGIKTQNLVFPISPSVFGREGLFKSSLGSGEWTRGKYNTETSMLDADITIYQKLSVTDGSDVEYGDMDYLKFNGIYRFEGYEQGCYGYIPITTNKEAVVFIDAECDDEDYGFVSLEEPTGGVLTSSLLSIGGENSGYCEIPANTTIYIGFIMNHYDDYHNNVEFRIGEL